MKSPGEANAPAAQDSSKQDSSKQDSSKQDSSKQDSSKRDSSEQTSGASSARARWRPLIFLAVLVAIIILARALGIGERFGELRGWIETLGAWGPVVFVLLYIVAAVAALPGSALTVAAGALFGSALGVIVVSVGATIGASLSFLIARYFARGAVARWLLKNEKFRKLDQLTEEHGAIIVALTRLVPIFPFNLLNYGFGLTRVPFRTYVFWSWLCMLPGTALYVVGADALTSSIAQGKIPYLLIAAIVSLAIVLAVLVRFARRKLKEKEAESLI